MNMRNIQIFIKKLWYHQTMYEKVELVIMKTIDVILPVYNQFESIKKTMYAFSKQNVLLDMFNIIIVDDGSLDELLFQTWDDFFYKYGIKGKIIHQNNKGRAAARNAGIKFSKSDIIIFCDADRLPKPNFIEQHLLLHSSGCEIVIGASYDYFGLSTQINEDYINWSAIYKYSRLPQYFKRISAIYNEKGETYSSLSWLSFLVGNSSIQRKLINDIGGFDEDFVNWGFEHFELAYRLFEKGHKFTLNKLAASYHIPHARSDKFYENAIINSANLFSKKHPSIDRDVLINFIKGKIDIINAEKTLFKCEKSDFVML